MTEIQLYDYQTQAVEALRGNIKAEVRKQILCAPTGSGKTVMAIYLIKSAYERGSRAMFLCDRVALINQTSAMLDKYGIPHGVIQANHWRKRPDERIQVVSQATAARRGWKVGYDLIIVDECHTVHDATAKMIKSTKAVVIGLTATPFTPELRGLYEGIVSVTTTNKLIDEGKLCPFTVFAPATIDMTGAATRAGEWTDSAREERALRVVGDVVTNYLKYAQGRKFIAFGATIRHCEQMREELMGAGVRCELYTSDTSGSERDAILDDFRGPNATIQGLLSVSALAKGFDVPDVSCIIIARPLKSSFAEHIQILGRGLRSDPTNPEKTCIILDHAENCVRFGGRMAEFFEHSVSELPDEKKKKSKKVRAYDYYTAYFQGDEVRYLGREYRATCDIPPRVVPSQSDAWEVTKQVEIEWRKCPKCSHVHQPKPECPNCAYEYPRREVLHEEGELVSIDIHAAKSNEQIRWWAGLRHMSTERPGDPKKALWWAKYRFKDRFGVFPSHWVEALPPREPDPDVKKWVHNQTARFIIAQKAVGAR
jgi:DNA repair protein RadD